MGASGSVPSKNRIQQAKSPRVTGKITNSVVQQQEPEIHHISEAVVAVQHTLDTKSSSFRMLNIKSYEKHDEQVLNEWSNVLQKSHKANIVPGDELDYSVRTLEPFQLFSDLVQSVDEQSALKGARVRNHQVVLVTVKGYPTPIASCLRMERYIDGSNNETTVVFSELQLLPSVEQLDQKLATVLQNSIIRTVSKESFKLPSNMVSDSAIPIISVSGNEEFENIMSSTEECLVAIDSGKEFSTDNISNYLWTSLGIPLLHFAVSVDNSNAVKRLLDCGARIEHKDCFGRNALFYVKSQTVANILIQKLKELDILESELGCIDTSSQLLSHIVVSNYHQNPGVTKSILYEITKDASKDACIGLFNSINANSKTAIDILKSQVYSYAKKFKNTSHHTLMTFLFEEIKWQIENKVNFQQLLQTKLIPGGSLSFFAEAASEENIALLHFFLENRIIDNEIDVSEFITSVHVAKMVVQLVPEIFDRYIHDNSEKTTTSSPLSRVIQNMRSGNLPLINFIIEQYDYKLLPYEMNQIIELSINKRTQSKMLPTLEKCISLVTDSSLLVQTKIRGELFSKLKKANTIFSCSPFELILSLDRKVSDAVGKIEKMMWDRIKSISATDDIARSLLLNSCGFLLSEIIRNKKFDLVEDVAVTLIKFGLSESHLDSKTNHHKWTQEDIIYNSISSLLNSTENTCSGLTVPVLKSLISVSRNREDLQTHILILALFMQRADMAILKKVLSTKQLFPSFGNVFEITDDLKSQFFDLGELKLKKFIQPCTTVDNLPPVCENSYIDLNLETSRKSELFPLLVKDGFVPKHHIVFMEKCDLAFFKSMADSIEPDSWRYFVENFYDLVLEKNFKDQNKLEYLIKKEPEYMQESFMLCIIKEYLGYKVTTETYSEIASHGTLESSCFALWKKCFSKNKSMSLTCLNVLLEQDTCNVVTGLFRLEILDKVISNFKKLNSDAILACTNVMLSIRPNTETKKQQYELLTDAIIHSLPNNILLDLLSTAIKKSNCEFIRKLIQRIEHDLGMEITWEVEQITEAILYSLRSGCDNLLFSLLTSSTLTLERLLSLKSNEKISMQPLHAICFGGCLNSLKHIYETLPKNELVPHFFNVIELYPLSTNNANNVNNEDEDENDDYEEMEYELPYRELSVPTLSLLNCNVKMNDMVFEIMRDIAMTTPIPKSVFGTWSNDQNIFQRILSSKIPLQSPNGKFDPFTFGKSIWMQHLIDKEDIYQKCIEEYGENAKSFIRMMIEILIFGDANSFIGAPKDKKLWVEFFRCYFRLKCTTEGDFNTFLKGFMPSLTETDVLLALQDYFYDMDKSMIATELLEIMKFDFKGNSNPENLPRSLFLVDIIVKEWDNLLRYILDLVNESEEIETQFWTMREDIEISVQYLNPKYENKCVELLFGKSKLLGKETHELLYSENNNRIITTSDEIRIAELRGKVLRDKVWTMRKAERDVGLYISQTVKFEPALTKFSVEQAKILTSISVFGDVEKMIGRDKNIETVHVVVCNTPDNLKSNIENSTLFLRVYLDKEIVHVGELEGGNRKVDGF